MAQQALDQPLYTYSDYLTWPEEHRCELIDGRIFSMAPAPTPDHQTVIVELTTQIALQLRGKPCRVLSAPLDVRLREKPESEDEIKNVVQPDILVVCDSNKLGQKGCLGAPDWIIEVLSPRTAAKGHIHKRLLYERHGVLEYWLVHPTDRLVTIYRLNTESKYSQAEILEPVAGKRLASYRNWKSIGTSYLGTYKQLRQHQTCPIGKCMRFPGGTR